MLHRSVILCCVLALTACSSTVAPAPAPPKPTLSITAQRNAAQAALAAEFGIGLLTLIFGNGTSQTYGAVGGGAPACNNGLEVTIVSTASQIVTTIDAFYDPICTKLLAHIVFTQTKTSATTSTLVGTATFTTQTGTVVAYNSLSGTVSASGGTTSFSVTGSIAPNQSSPATASFGLSCAISATTNTCGFGGLTNVSLLSTEFGNTFTLSGTQSGSTSSGTSSLQGYTSALNAMTLSPSGATAWTITGGGSPVVSGSGTFSVTTTVFNLATQIFVSLADNNADARGTAAMSGGPFGNTSGSVVQLSTGVTATTFGTDGIGTGTITYSDASTASISGFVVQ